MTNFLALIATSFSCIGDSPPPRISDRKASMWSAPSKATSSCGAASSEPTRRPAADSSRSGSGPVGTKVVSEALNDGGSARMAETRCAVTASSLPMPTKRADGGKHSNTASWAACSLDTSGSLPVNCSR